MSWGKRLRISSSLVSAPVVGRDDVDCSVLCVVVDGWGGLVVCQVLGVEVVGEAWAGLVEDVAGRTRNGGAVTRT